MRINNFYSVKRLGVWVLILVGILALSSCLRDNLVEPINGELTIRAKVVVPIETPSTRSRVVYEDNDNNVGPEIQRYVNDVYALIFDEEGESLLYSVKMNLASGDNMDETQTYDASIVLDETLNATMWIVTNVEQNGFTKAEVQELVGKSKAEVQAALVFPYDYTENTDGLTLSGWDITQHSLPMWGEATTSSGSAALTLDPESGNMIYVYANMYRAVAKMGFTIAMEEEDDYATFNLREVYVYYAQDAGAAVPGVENEPDSDWQYLTPDVPSSSSTLSAPIKYDLGDGIYNGEEWFNEVFLAECDNSEAPSNGLVLVLGGIYAPDGVSDAEEMSYYRVDMVNDIGTVDVIRNHSYIFRIVGIESVGTSDPDPDRATDGLIVEIEDYTEEEMKGINSQYTLTVNQSAFAFNAIAAEVKSLEIETDGTTWSWDNGVYYRGTDTDGAQRYFVYIVTDEYGNLTVYDGETLEELNLPSSREDAGLVLETIGTTTYVFYQYFTDEGVACTVLVNWLNITAGEITSTSGSYEYTAEPNIGIWEFNRYAYFYITAGSIRKQIQFAQPVGESANSTVITKAGTYAFNATKRGNGGTSAETDTGDYDDEINFAFSTTLSKDEINSVGLIWETSDGLVTVTWDEEAQELFEKTGCVKYTVNNVPMYTPDGYPSYSGYWGGYVFDEGNGGNALIGTFDENNQLLWSWHVWVVPDYFDGVKTELWGTGYEYMDRNLGAYSNLPGSKSFGLLYQWGRKDPFIGAYREDHERDYHTVPKQYTNMGTNPATNEPWSWGDYDDSTFEGSYDGEEAILEYTVHCPTTLLDDGLLSGDHAYSSAHGLWGCESTDVQEEEHGSKTMWDPCPEGYRVPTLNALTINDGTNDMWDVQTDARVGLVQTQHASQTLRYVPIANDGNTNPWQTGGNTSTFVSDAPFYGFWLEYGDWGGTGNFASTYSTSYGVGYYDTENDPSFSSFGYIDGYVGTKPDWATWLPLAGLYNGSMDHFGRAGMTDQGPDNDPYLPASSLQVTSVLWGNSPTATNSDYPGGLLLHGTEGAYALHNGDTMYEYSAGTVNGLGGGTPSSVATEGEGYWTNEHNGASNTVVAWWTGTDNSDDGWNYNDTYVNATTASWSDENGMPGSGRHFHSFADPTISTLANPSYAASVRCIVDKQRLNAAANVVYEADGTTVASGTYNLYQYAGTAAASASFELSFSIYSIESWQVSNPGAKWISVSPMSGNTADAYGSMDELTVKYNSSTTSTPEEGETATVTIKFLIGSTQTIAISYAGVYSGN